jgi:hypothetical protein
MWQVFAIIRPVCTISLVFRRKFGRFKGTTLLPGSKFLLVQLQILGIYIELCGQICLATVQAILVCLFLACQTRPTPIISECLLRKYKIKKTAFLQTVSVTIKMSAILGRRVAAMQIVPSRCRQDFRTVLNRTVSCKAALTPQDGACLLIGCQIQLAHSIEILDSIAEQPATGVLF